MIELPTITYKYSKYRVLIPCVFFVGFCVVLDFFLFSKPDFFGKDWSRMFGYAILGTPSSLLLFYLCFKLLLDERDVLIVSSEGVFDSRIANGTIRWADVEGVHVAYSRSGSRVLQLETNLTPDLLEGQTNQQKFYVRQMRGICISSWGLRGSQASIFENLMAYFEHSRSTEDLCKSSDVC